MPYPGQLPGICTAEALAQSCDRAAQSLQVCQAQLLDDVALEDGHSLRQRCLLPAQLP